VVATSTGTSVRAPRTSWAEWLGTIGWAAKGIIYLLLAVIVAQLAFSGDTGDESATKEGALARLSDQPMGELMLTIVGVGLAAYAAYRLLSIFLPTTGNDDKDKAKHLLRLGSAAVYGLLAWQAWSVLTSRDDAVESSGGSEAPKTWSASMLSSTLGRVVLAVVGIALIAIAVDQVRRGATQTFMKRIDCPGGFPSDRVIGAAGTIGHIGRGVVAALLGLFVVIAVVQHDPNQVRGLDEALRTIADATLGSIVLMVVAFGLVSYGVYSLMAARCRRHSEG
jgi:hypothetical protein